MLKLPFVLGLCVLSASSLAEVRSYDAEKADQFLKATTDDIIPDSESARKVWLKNKAFEAAIFGRVAVLTYKQIYDQAVDPASSDYVGFNRFSHGRDLAGPGYKPFKTPNADTLYSNAYLDLSAGPVLLTVPPTRGRYYTVNFLDLYANATNISARTHGTDGGKYLLATTDWVGEVPEGVTLFRVTQPYMWILMRIALGSLDELPAARALQDGFIITGEGPKRPRGFYPMPATNEDPASFLRVLAWVVKNAGVQRTELGHVAGFSALGIGGKRSIDDVIQDEVAMKAISEGISEADMLIGKSIGPHGTSTGSGWRYVADLGGYGHNYLSRAVVNTLGTGANVRRENFAFTSFVDGAGEPLDGSKHAYALRFETPPPSDFFWSVTVYERQTQELAPNPASKYLVSGNTPGLRIDKDGSVTIHLTTDPGGPNDLPIPAGPFYVALRAQGPHPEMLSGEWKPSPIQKAGKKQHP
ncbi:hypothetical protein PS874_01521 [Pseudomonas fluorescens]|nr:hypothetical protein PS874_01521 [Pseudomonas fluorescens]